jgi:hypothetical protein
MSEGENSNLVQKGCGCWLFFMATSMLILAVVYIFSDGSLSVVKKRNANEFIETQLRAYLPKQLKNDDKIIDAFKKNESISDINIYSTAPSKDFFGGTINALPFKFGSIFSESFKDPFELDSTVDMVILTFVYENRTRIKAKFIVVKGKYWSFLTEEGRQNFKPWAQYVGLMKVDTEKL